MLKTLYNSILDSLREFMFNLDTQNIYEEKPIDTAALQKIKGLILGGHPKWQDRMKEILPNLKFLSVENVNFDTNILNISILYIFIRIT